jgi:hypothetical protein
VLKLVYIIFAFLLSRLSSSDQCTNPRYRVARHVIKKTPVNFIALSGGFCVKYDLLECDAIKFLTSSPTFRETYCHHLQGRRVKNSFWFLQRFVSLPHFPSWCLLPCWLSLLVDPETSISFRPFYTVWLPRINYVLTWNQSFQKLSFDLLQSFRALRFSCRWAERPRKLHSVSILPLHDFFLYDPFQFLFTFEN